jgi:hypothetical protein
MGGMNTQLVIAEAGWIVETRYGEEDWVHIASFRYYDQAHLFVAAMRKSFGGFDYRVTEASS